MEDGNLNVRIMYCVEDEFPPKFKFGDALPNLKELRENWKVLPNWVYENLAEDGMSIEYDDHMAKDEELPRFGNLLENIFRRMNSYETNPLALEYVMRIDCYENGQTPKLLEPDNPRFGQEWMKEHNVHHTSMSVGDIVEINGKLWHCQRTGWKLINIENHCWDNN